MTRNTKAVSDLSVWELADLAEVSSPDTESSPGASFLMGVRGDVADRWEREEFDDVEQGNDGDVTWQIADNAPDVMNYQRMMELVDLGAFNEEIDENLIGKNPTMIDLAGLALYQVAERLVDALVAELRSALAEDMEADAEYLADQGGELPV